MKITAALALVLLLAGAASAQQWRDLFNGKNLDGWEVRGDGVWTVMPDGVLVGQRLHRKPADPFGQPWPIDSRQYRSWLYRQAWLYTRRDFGEFDLHVEYWVPPHMNSGVSIRDVSRAHYAIGEPDTVWTPPAKTPQSTPAHIGYEIQIIDPDNDGYPSGSVYLFTAAKRGVQKSGDWNSLEIEARNRRIRVRLNGVVVAESPGDPARSKTGPIGLQLHDQFTFMLFRNIRIREVK